MNKALYEKNLINDILNKIKKNNGQAYLSSIILTGSFGRGEPTYAINSDGSIMLKSDIEIALIFPKSFQKKKVAHLIESVSSQFDEDLNLMAINEKRICKAYNFNFSLRVPKYKTIFTYDLFNGSKTIWGTDFIGEKEISLSNIDSYEAKRLIANRIGELSFLEHTMGSSLKVKRQWKGKVVLAIVSAYLICSGKYVSSYHDQLNNFKEDKDNAENIIGDGFYEEYYHVFKYLRESGVEYEVSDDLLRIYVKNIDKYLKSKEINKSHVNSLSRYLKYFIKYLSCGCKFGILRFEDKILQNLIDDYANNSDRLNKDAVVWHKVLY